MRVVEEQFSQLVQLYRGEAATKLPSLMRYGIQAKRRFLAQRLPDPDWYNLATLPLTFVPIDSARLVRLHVSAHRPSPFVSFTTDRNVALKYAMNGGQGGVLLNVQVRLVRAVSWSTFLGPGSALCEDDKGRRWVSVARYRSPGADDFGLEPARALGRRDSEVLLIGDLPPGAFSMRAVR